MPMDSRKILGIKIDFGMSMDDVIDVVENKLLKDDKCHYICTTNPEFVIDAQKDNEFARIINESDLSVPDGSGVIYAKNYIEGVEKFKKNIFFPIRAFFYGTCLGISSFFEKYDTKDKRIPGVELTYKLCEVASKKGYNVFFLGGRAKNLLGKHIENTDSDLAKDTASVMLKLYPSINVIGATSKFNRSQEDDQKTLDYIKQCMNEKGVDHIDFLFVAYNHIHQEKWIVRNSNKVPAKVSIGVGGTFDFIIGQCELPPEKYSKKNLGWLYRLIKQPWRVKRIYKAFPLFPLKVFIKSIQK
jgi:N-acetylglucosaminyldiphosphoundecaprenol N-acetyl-beta-D-mannosaminyltransferase